MRSPFRYPGGKSKFLPILLPILQRMEPRSFSEPFVGGGSVTLAMAESFPKCELFLNDLNADLAAFWTTLAQEDVDEICERISVTTPSLDLFYHIKESTETDRITRAFRILFLNRCSFSGLGVNPIGGKHQRSAYKVGCRWNSERLVKLISDANRLLRGRTSVTNVDALSTPWAESVYLDPPYFIQGPALYTTTAADLSGKDIHNRLSDFLRSQENWVLSYDDVDSIRALYAWADIRAEDLTYTVGNYSDGRNRKGRELVIQPYGASWK